MNRFVFAAWSAVMLVALPGGAFAADITYNLNSFAPDQDGYTLSGSITTDGTIGVLTKSDFVAWTWTVSNGSTTFTASSTDAGAAVSTEGTIMTNATGTQILVPFAKPSPSSVGNGLALAITGEARLVWVNNPDMPNQPYYEALVVPPNTDVFWDTQNPQMGGFTDWIIAGPIPVPEPSSLILGITASIAGLGVWSRRRGQTVTSA